MIRICGVLVFGFAVVSAGAQVGASAGGDVVTKSGRVVADSDLARTIEGLVSAPAVARAHWGIDVVGLDGTPIYSMNEAEVFSAGLQCEVVYYDCGFGSNGCEYNV